MRIHNLYVDAKGETHFRDIEVEWVEEREFSKYSTRLPATGIIFRETSPDYDLDWHPAPRRQYIINLDGGVQITASDGESRVIGAGEVLLVEDTSGKGHLSKSVGGKMRRSIFVPIDESSGQPQAESGTRRVRTQCRQCWAAASIAIAWWRTGPSCPTAGSSRTWRRSPSTARTRSTSSIAASTR